MQGLQILEIHVRLISFVSFCSYSGQWSNLSCNAMSDLSDLSTKKSVHHRPQRFYNALKLVYMKYCGHDCVHPPILRANQSSFKLIWEKLYNKKILHTMHLDIFGSYHLGISSGTQAMKEKQFGVRSWIHRWGHGNWLLWSFDLHPQNST